MPWYRSPTSALVPTSSANCCTLMTMVMATPPEAAARVPRAPVAADNTHTHTHTHFKLCCCVYCPALLRLCRLHAAFVLTAGA